MSGVKKNAERTWTDLSRDPDALRAYLDKLDQDFATPQRRIEIPARPFQAWLTIQREFNISMSLGSELMKPVDDYFAKKYARRANIDMTLGRFLVRIGHEAWAVKFPLVYGTRHVDFPTMLEDGTPAIVAQLTKPERRQLEELLPRAYEAFFELRHVPTDLRVDWPNAVSQALDPRGNYGASKWSSQQVVEKMLSAYVVAHGGVVPEQAKKRHNLPAIAQAAYGVGLQQLDRDLINSVQCGADTRYPSNTIQLTEAIRANQASVLLCGELARQWRDLPRGRLAATVRSVPSTTDAEALERGVRLLVRNV